MELNDRDIEWLKDAPTLAAIGNGIPFTVPSGYFDHLSKGLKSRIRVESMRVDETNGFKVPENYFEELSSRIENRVSVENIKELAPSEGFSLPEEYFAGLTARINQRIEESSERGTPVRRLFSSWVSYAAAACITALIATGIYFNSDTYTFNKQLSEIPDEEIINYLQAHSTAGDTPFIIETLNPDELEKLSPAVSAEELEQYINSTTL
jgi:hypothetical protein